MSKLIQISFKNTFIYRTIFMGPYYNCLRYATVLPVTRVTSFRRKILSPFSLLLGCVMSLWNAGIARSKRDGTRAVTRFGLSAKRTSPFKSAGVSVQSTTGSRGVRNSGQRFYRPCSDVQCKAAGYPLHSHLSPSLPHPCVTLCHQVPNALYQHTRPSRITTHASTAVETWSHMNCPVRDLS